LEQLLREVKYYPSQTSHAKPISIKIDWKRGEHTALCLFDNAKLADEARYQLRGRTLPNLSSQKLRIDFCDKALFDLSLRNQHEPPSSSSTPPYDKHATLPPVRLEDTRKKVDLRSIKRERSRTRSTSRGGDGGGGGRSSRSSRDETNKAMRTSLDERKTISPPSPPPPHPHPPNTPTIHRKQSVDELEEGQMEDDVKQEREHRSSLDENHTIEVKDKVGTVTTTTHSGVKELTIETNDMDTNGTSKDLKTLTTRTVYVEPFSPQNTTQTTTTTTTTTADSTCTNSNSSSSSGSISSSGVSPKTIKVSEVISIKSDELPNGNIIYNISPRK
jgi:hypothetical protein